MKLIKQLVIYQLTFFVTFSIVYNLQAFIIKTTNSTIRFNILDTNMFFAIASVLICIHLYIFTYIKALRNLLGFIYLPTVAIKVLLFYFSFQYTIFGLDTFTAAERLHLVIPSLLYLIIEVFFIAKLLDTMPK